MVEPTQKEVRDTYVLARFEELKKKIGTPGYPSLSTIIRAEKFALYRFTDDLPTPNVIPGENGSLSFIWHRGITIDLEICPNEKIQVFVCDNKKEKSFELEIREGDSYENLFIVLDYLTIHKKLELLFNSVGVKVEDASLPEM